jgi:RNA polymerase sigma factor (sigma-70 family)
MNSVELLFRSGQMYTAAMPHYQTQPTQTLVQAASDGNTEALNVLCERLVPRLKAWIHGQLPSHARDLRDTEDIVVETLWSSVQRLKGLDLQEEGSFLKYLRTALKNRIYKEVRRQKARPGQTELDASTIEMENPIGPRSKGPDEETDLRQAMTEYEVALENMSPSEQDLIIARLEFGMSFTQVAEWFGKPSEDAARMAVNRAVKKLASTMSHVKEKP